jgi:hypothetical protein
MRKQLLPAVLILSGSLVVLYWVAWNASASVAPTDLRAFWAAAKLIKTNPYDNANAAILEHTIPGCSNCDMVMGNPPWALVFVLPLARVDYRTAYAIVLVVNLALILGCSVTLWHVFGGSTSPVPVLVALSFGPAIWLIRHGQTSALPLLGITLFCWAARHEYYFTAGASLLLVAVKPHLFIPLFLVLLVWALHRRKFELIAGALTSIVSASMVSVAFNRHIFSQYLNLVSRAARWENLFFQSFGGWLEYVTGSRIVGMIPTLAGIGFSFWYWQKRRNDPLDEFMPALVLISVATSYYGYVYDHVVLLVPIIALLRSRHRTWMLVAGGTLNAVVWVHAVYGDRTGLSETFPWWMALGWLVACWPLLFGATPTRRRASLGSVAAP